MWSKSSSSCFCVDLTVLTLKPRQSAWQHRHLWSKQVFAKHRRRNIKDISGPGSRAMQMRSHPFGNVHRMQLQISPGYTGLFVPRKTRLFHRDVSFMLLPGSKSFTRTWQLFNLARKHNKGSKTQQKNSETSNITSICEVSDLSIRFGCWQHSWARFYNFQTARLIRKPQPGYWSRISFH